MPVVARFVFAAVKVLWPGGLNTSLYLDLNRVSRQTPWAHGFMHAYALWLGLTLMAALFLVAYALAWWRGDVRAAALLFVGGVGTLVALGLNQLVGHAAGELRPYDTYRHALVLVAKAHDFAFPSDHATVAGALFVSILLVVRPAGSRSPGRAGGGHHTPASRPRTKGSMVLLAAVAAVVCLFLLFARVYVGAHYPGDVVAGVLLGGVVVLLVSAMRPLAYWVADAVARTPLAVLVRRPSSEPGGGGDVGGRRARGAGGEGDLPASP
ncbi:MAG: phosphatase PAP2 family protein [Actinomycetota bacterium]|jgi:undecaprenyl-diphosphatase|nr:phosphatase PAP2 family protein [Actinomycetota bacterium]